MTNLDFKYKLNRQIDSMVGRIKVKFNCLQTDFSSSMHKYVFSRLTAVLLSIFYKSINKEKILKKSYFLKILTLF